MKGLLIISAISLLAASISATRVPVSRAPVARAPLARAPIAAHSQAAKVPAKKLILTSEPECVPGSTYPSYDDCNTCTCPCSGLMSEAVCTDKPECCRSFEDICFPGVPLQLEDENSYCDCPASGLISESTNCFTLAPPTPSQVACIPNTKYSTKGDKFFVCDCPANGIQPESIYERQCAFWDVFIPIPCDICTPGATFKREDGGRCTCPESGSKNDTTFCDYTPIPPVVVKDCVPGAIFLDADGVTSCECPSSGIKSEAVCPPPSICDIPQTKKKNQQKNVL